MGAVQGVDGLFEPFCVPSACEGWSALNVRELTADIDILHAAEAEAHVFKVSALSSKPGVPEVRWWWGVGGQEYRANRETVKGGTKPEELNHYRGGENRGRRKGELWWKFLWNHSGAFNVWAKCRPPGNSWTQRKRGCRDPQWKWHVSKQRKSMFNRCL